MRDCDMIVRYEESEGIYEELIVACLEENISIIRDKHKRREHIRKDQKRKRIRVLIMQHKN